MNKIILTDVDDVLFDWSGEFTKWVLENTNHRPSRSLKEFWHIEKWLDIPVQEAIDLVNVFNTCPDHWPNFKGIEAAKEVISRLSSDGYKFVAITACKSDEWAKQKRIENIEREFGNSFLDVHCVYYNESKYDYLKKYDPTYWIDDKYDNIVDGFKAGHKCFLMNMPHNSEYENDGSFTRVDNWYQFEHYIKS